jgi:hypothetical protein
LLQSEKCRKKRKKKKRMKVNDLQKARRMAWDFARTYAHDKDLGASPNPMLLWASNMIRDLADEIEFRKIAAIDAQEKADRIHAAFIHPHMGACPTCWWAHYGGANADADDCGRDDYDPCDPACVDDWWDSGECKHWKLASWLQEFSSERRETKS